MQRQGHMRNRLCEVEVSLLATREGVLSLHDYMGYTKGNPMRVVSQVTYYDLNKQCHLFNRSAFQAQQCDEVLSTVVVCSNNYPECLYFAFASVRLHMVFIHLMNK